MRVVNWTIPVLLSSALHVGAMVLYLTEDAPRMGAAMGAGESGVEIDLGLAGSYADSSEQSVGESEQTPDKALQQPEPEIPESLPEVVQPQEPVVEEAPMQELETTTAAIDEKNVVVAKPNELPEREAVESDPQSQTPAKNVNKPELQKPVEARASRQATGRANSRRSGGSVGDPKSYFGQLMSWLNQHKRYPTELKKKKTEGVVIVRFSIDRQGRLLSSEIKKSSGQKRLDDAALQMLADASPMPAIPESLSRQRLTLEIPVEYSLITNAFR